MQITTHWSFAAVLALGVALAGCNNARPIDHGEPPAHVEHLDGSELSLVTLTERAIERLDLKVTKVGEEAGRAFVPYSSLIYDPQGHTWVYVSPKPRTFVRSEVEVERIDGDRAFLSSGPSVGTQVASVGVAELYGTEFEVGH
jgi:hypothetical protein